MYVLLALLVFIFIAYVRYKNCEKSSNDEPVQDEPKHTATKVCINYIEKLFTAYLISKQLYQYLIET